MAPPENTITGNAIRPSPYARARTSCGPPIGWQSNVIEPVEPMSRARVFKYFAPHGSWRKFCQSTEFWWTPCQLDDTPSSAKPEDNPLFNDGIGVDEKMRHFYNSLSVEGVQE